MQKFYLLILFILLLLCSCTANNFKEVKEGDIIFQTSKSQQSKFIAYATHSLNTHCGIVVYKKGEPYVLEASNVIKLTPLKKFINKGLLGRYQIYRYTNTPVKIAYKNYLGIPYDSEFRWTDKRYYCSELVWKIYKKQLNVELCEPQELSSYTISGLEKVLNKRGISKTSLFVAPSDLSNSDKLYLIK